MVAYPAIRVPDVWRLGLSVMLVLIVTDGQAQTVKEGGPMVAFVRRPDGLQVTIGGKPSTRYHYGTEAITRPFFESIHAPDGTQVTRNYPPVEGVDLADHPTYHPGLWLAFGDLNGADSWRNKDRILHAGFVEEPQGGPGRGTFAIRNRYEKDDRVIGEEVCRITILVRLAGHLIVWDSVFRPVGGDLAFGDQEEMGLGLRVATPLAVVKGGRITDSECRVNEAQVWGKQADWCAYDGEIDGKRVGVLLMPGPGNFRRSWFHARDYGLLEANPFGRNAFTKGEKSRVTIKDGDTLRLRFGVLIWSGRPDLGAAYRDFLKQIGRER
jgi:Methane oxygenase PmoA